MSMMYYPVYEYAFVFTPDAIKKLKKEVTDKFGADVNDIIECLEDNGADFCYEAEFDGELSLVFGEREYDEQTIYCDGKQIVYIPLDKKPSLFEKAYENKEEIVEELKGKLNEYFDEKFNYLDYLYEVAGTYFG